MKNFKIRTPWLRALMGILLSGSTVIAITGCADDNVRGGAVYSSSHYYPYDYYYYPDTSVYFHISSGNYYYPYGRHWRRVKKLPPRYRLNHNHRRHIRSPDDRPYIRHHDHRKRYPATKYKAHGPRKQIDRRHYKYQDKHYRKNKSHHKGYHRP